MARHYTGTAGKVCHCQVMVNCHYAERTLAWPVATRLYLPRAWTDEPARCRHAHVPPEVKFQTKAEMALDLVAAVVAVGVAFACVVAEGDYGDNPHFLDGLEGHGQRYVAAVRKDFQVALGWGASTVAQRAEAVLAQQPKRAWQVLRWRHGQGPTLQPPLLLKDRYNSFWVFDNELKPLWSGTGQTGHYPYPYDFDGDGKDEFVIGFALWNASGKAVWSHDAAMKDHTDAISIGNYTGNPQTPPRVYSCGSDEGFVVIGADGKLIKQVRIGHAQTQSVAKYRPEATGLQIMTANFWRNTGIVMLFDADANILAQEELIPGSSHLQAVNWRGDGQEFALLNANIREGGMIDGHLRRVVMFPDDGHPDLAYQVLNVTGDERDEIIVWNTESVWIYTQDRPFNGTRMYKPTRNPLYNESNYRATVSLPDWRK